MEEFKIKTELSERKVETRDKQISHVIIPDLKVIEENFQATIDSIEQNIIFSDSIIEKGIKDNFLRAQIIFLESSFDYLIHCVIKYGFDMISKGEWATTEKFDHFLVPMSIIKLVRDNEDEKYFDDYLNEKISPMTFLDPNQLKDNLNFIFPDMLKELAKKVFPLEKQPLATLKKELNEMYDRRNLIAHQDNREHKNLNKHSITKDEVVKFKDDINLIVKEILNIVKQR